MFHFLSDLKDSKKGDGNNTLSKKAVSEYHIRSKSKSSHNLVSAFSKSKSEGTVYDLDGFDAVQRAKSATDVEVNTDTAISHKRGSAGNLSAGSNGVAGSFLKARTGLFGAMETTKTSKEDQGAVARRLRVGRNSLAGGESDTDSRASGRFGNALSDVEDIDVRETDTEYESEWERPLSPEPSEPPRVASPDFSTDDELDDFSKYFDKSRKLRSKNGIYNSNLKIKDRINSLSPIERKDDSNRSSRLSVHYLQSSILKDDGDNSVSSLDSSVSFSKAGVRFDNVDQRSDTSESSTSTNRSRVTFRIPNRHSIDDCENSDSDNNHVHQKPPEWRRLSLNSDYFQSATPITSINIKDSLSIDSGVSPDISKLRGRFQSPSESTGSSPELQMSPRNISYDDNNSYLETPQTVRFTSFQSIPTEQPQPKKKGFLGRFAGKKKKNEQVTSPKSAKDSAFVVGNYTQRQQQDTQRMYHQENMNMPLQPSRLHNGEMNNNSSSRFQTSADVHSVGVNRTPLGQNHTPIEQHQAMEIIRQREGLLDRSSWREKAANNAGDDGMQVSFC